MISIKCVATDETLQRYYPELKRYLTLESPIESLLDFEDPEYESISILRFIHQK